MRARFRCVGLALSAKSISRENTTEVNAPIPARRPGQVTPKFGWGARVTARYYPRMAMLEQSRAIEAIATAVRSGRSARRWQGSDAAVSAVADAVRGHGGAAARRAIAEARAAMLRPVDPSAIEWDVFTLFEHEDSESHWTKWLASILEPANGVAVSQIVWRALCSASALQGTEPRACVPEEQEALASLDTIRQSGQLPLRRGDVDREVHDAVLGRTDIVVSTPALLLVLENKLDEGWHDTAAGRQAERYRRFALQRRNKRKIALVLLTNRDDFRLADEHSDWLRIDYRALARSMRRELRASFAADNDATHALALWPVLMTIAAIERNLIELDVRLSTDPALDPSWVQLQAIAEVARYLRDEE